MEECFEKALAQLLGEVGKEILPSMAKVGQGSSVEFCKRYEQYIAPHRSWDQRAKHLTATARTDLWKKDNDILKELRTAWQEMALEERDGLILGECILIKE